MRSAFLLSFAVVTSVSFASFDETETWREDRSRNETIAQRLRTSFADCRARVNEPAENIVVPIECWPDGSIRSSVSAEQAQFFLDEGLIWGKNVRIVQNDASGAPEAQIQAGECLIDRKAKAGWAEGEVLATYRKTQIKGCDVYFSLGEEYVKIFAKPEMHTEDIEFKGFDDRHLTEATAHAATITADCADYDRGAGILAFDGSVRLDETEFKAAADELRIHLVGTNDLAGIVAQGDVALTNGARSGTCDRLVYEKAKGRIALSGAEDRRACLVDDGGSRYRLEGSEIVFWVDSEQVEVMDSVITIDGVDFAGRGGLGEMFGK